MNGSKLSLLSSEMKAFFSPNKNTEPKSSKRSALQTLIKLENLSWFFFNGITVKEQFAYNVKSPM